MSAKTKKEIYRRWILTAICMLMAVLWAGGGCGRISSVMQTDEDAFLAEETTMEETRTRSAGTKEQSRSHSDNHQDDRQDSHPDDRQDSHPDDHTDDLGADGSSGSPSGKDNAQSSQEELFYVHVCGEVKSPGLYRIAAGSRAGQAIEAAGGFTKKADTSAVNLASTVEDGQQIYVPDQSEKAGMQTDSAGRSASDREAFSESDNTGEGKTTGDSGNKEGKNISGKSESSEDVKSTARSGSSDSGKININTAGMEELCTLSGIGESRAAAILEYRQEHGRFSSISDICNVTGIGEGIYSRLKDSITV